MSGAIKQLNLQNSSRSRLQTIIQDHNKNVLTNQLDKYRIIKLMSSGDYQCKDQYGNTYLLVCQLEEGGFYQFKNHTKNNFQRNANNRALIIPFQDIRHDGVTFTVYMLPQRSVCLQEAFSSKVKSQIFCLSLLYTLIKKVIRPLIDIFGYNAERWLHAENIWLKETTIFYILNQRKKQNYSIKRTQQKQTQNNYKSVDLNNQQRQSYQKQILRKLCINIAPFFKLDQQIKSFLSIIVEAMLNQQFTIQQICLLLSDKRKRKSFMDDKSDLFVNLQVKNQNGEIYNNKNQLWGRKRSYYIDSDNNRRGLKNQTLNVQLTQKQKRQQFYTQNIRNGGQSINIPPSFKQRKRSSLSITGLFSFKDKSRKKRSSLSSSKGNSRYQGKFAGSSQEIQQNMKRTLDSFLRQNKNSYSVDIEQKEKAYRRFRETIQTSGTQDQKVKKLTIHQQQKHLKAYLEYKSKQKSRKFSTIDISQIKHYALVSKKKISQTIEHSQIQRQKNEIRKNLFTISQNKTNLIADNNDQMLINDNKNKMQIMRFSTQQQQQNKISLQKQKQKQKQRQRMRENEVQRELQRLKKIEEEKQKEIEKLKQKQKQRQRSRQRERQRIKQKQKQLERQIQKQKQKIRQQEQKIKNLEKQRQLNERVKKELFEIEKQKERHLEKLREEQKERQRSRQRQRIKEKQREREKQQREREREKEREKERERQRQRQRQRQMQLLRLKQKQKEQQLKRQRVQKQLEKEMEIKKNGQMKRNQSAQQVKTKNITKNSYEPNLDQIQIIQPIKKCQLDAKKQKQRKEFQERQKKQNKPPLPSDPNKSSQGFRKKSSMDQVQQIILENKTIKNPPQIKKPEIKPQPLPPPKQIKKQKVQDESGSRTKTVTSQIASSCGPKKPVSKQVAQYLHMINKIGEGVAKSSKISAKLEGVEWFTGVYFVYKRFLFERKKIERWLTKKQPFLTRYQQKNNQQWEDWFKTDEKKNLQQKIKVQNQNILASLIKMNKKLLKKNLNANIIHHAAINKQQEQQSKIVVSEVVKQYDDLDQKQKLKDQEILTHINQMLNSLYIIAELDGKIKEKKPLLQILKMKNEEQLSEFSDYIYDLYIKQ